MAEVKAELEPIILRSKLAVTIQIDRDLPSVSRVAEQVQTEFCFTSGDRSRRTADPCRSVS